MLSISQGSTAGAHPQRGAQIQGRDPNPREAGQEPGHHGKGRRKRSAGAEGKQEQRGAGGVTKVWQGTALAAQGRTDCAQRHPNINLHSTAQAHLLY